MTVLTFFVAKLVVDGGQKKAMLYLRHKCANDEDADITASEGSMTAFCFPLGPESVVPKEYMASEEYTFTLTGGDGKRYQGFCRKFLPPKPAVGSKQQLPQVLCLMSEDPWATFYFKVLQVLEQLVKSGDGLLGSDAKQLPDSSHAAIFLRDLGTQLAGNPRPSEIVRVALPKSVDLTGVSPHRLLGNPSGLSEEYLELQVPLDCGNGRWNCGVSLARLLWDVPIPALTTLLASMLLERRIILVSSQRDTVTAAVQAASALLYPFKWHHIYLPMLPQAFKDYLSAPMPFMVGLQSQMLGMLSSIPMDEITVIDLDIRSCKPAPGSPMDDARGLPWREQLEAALTAAHKLIRSPTEHETSPLIASIIQEFFVKLFGNYRRFIHVDTPALNAKWAAQVASPSGATPQNSPRLHRESMSGRAPGAESGERSGHGAGSSTRGTADNVMKAAGYVFEHTAFVRSHRRNEKARTFLSHLRGSQLYAMFVQERLEEAAAAAQGRGDDALAEDPFEQRVDRYQVRRRMRFDKLRASKGGSAITRQWNNLIKRHRRTDSEEAAMMGNLDLGGSAGLAASMRRIITCPSGNMAGQQSEVDPALFFPEDDEDDYEDLQEATSSLGRLDTGQGGRVFSASAALPSNSPPHLERTAASFAVPGSSGLYAHSTNHRLAAVSSPVVRVGSHGSQPAGTGTAASEDTRQGVNITVAQGTLGDKFKSAVTDLTSAIGRRVNSTSTATSNMAAAAGLAASNTIAAAATFTSNLTSSSSSGYRQQLTGDNNQPKGGLARYMPQSTGGGLSLLDMANGRLKPPPSSARPLLLPQQQGSSSSVEANLAQQGSSSSGLYEGSQLGRTSAAASSGGLPTQPAVPSQPMEPTQQAQQGPGLAAGLLSQRLSGANNGLQTVASVRGGVTSGPQGSAPLPAISDTSPLIDGFDGFALLASARVEPPRSQPSGTQAVSLLDL